MAAVRALPWVGAACVFVAGLTALRHGAALGPDAWAYWSGSVSLLEGRGYVDAFGLPIRDWPPGYALWLAAVQAVLGVSVRSVVIADVLAASVWTGFLIAWALLRADRSHVPVARWPLFVFLVASPLLALRGPAAEVPMLALFAVALWAVERWRATRRNFAWIAVVAAAVGGMVVTRHAALAFVPAFAVAMAVVRERTPQQRAVAAAVVVAAAMVSWWWLRMVLGQEGTYPWQGGTRSFGELIVAMTRGIDRCIAPLPLGITIAVAVALVGGPAQGWCARRGMPAASVRHGDVVAFVTVALAALLAMFLAVPIADPPRERFVRFAALLLGSTSIVIAAALPSRPWRVALLVLLVLPTTVHAGKHVVLGRTGRNTASAEGGESFLPGTATLQHSVAPGAVLPDGRIVVAMPRFRWLDARLRGGRR